MDSLSQIVLGAAVGVAVLGRRMGPRRAAIAGGILGTLPDLDVLVRYDDPVDSFIMHRGWSHSLLVQAAVTPLFGEAMLRLSKALRDQRMLTYIAVYLCLSTHALLDAMTIYGTKLLWPLSVQPFAVGSVFIIDALYTLPLLVAMIWALTQKDWTPRIGKVVAAGLILSSAYQAWCFTAQQVVTARAQAFLQQQHIAADRLLAIPTPFNSYLWRVIALQDREDRYLNIYMPVFGGPAQTTVYSHPRGTALKTCLGENAALEKLAWFSRGYYRLDRRPGQGGDEGNDGGDVVLSDMRMGLTPNYAFQFAINGDVPRRLGGSRGTQADIDWLLANLWHDPVTRRAEVAARLNLQELHRTVAANAGDRRC